LPQSLAKTFLFEYQNKAIGKLRLLWGRFSQEATSSWLNEINAYASGDKG